ncbi:MAG: transcription termination factor NusA [bacterium]
MGIETNNIDIIEALDTISRERGIPYDVLIEAVESALVSAYKKDHKSSANIYGAIDIDTGDVRIYNIKKVVNEVSDSRTEISLEEARKYDGEAQIGDEIDIDVTPKDYGRIAAQAAKQVIMQKIREAERTSIYNEYKAKEGTIINGVVHRFDPRTENIIVDLGRIEALLPRSEQSPSERYRQGDRIKAYVLRVDMTTRDPDIILSRSCPEFLRELFKIEVPEIADGTVEIKSIAREAGYRSKVAVHSRNELVDAVGACVGMRGVRVQAIVRELNGEKIDIVRWSTNIEDYVRSALNPAKITHTSVSEKDKQIVAVVDDEQLSLAIGKGGQNVRLAAKLTGWHIDIKSTKEFEEMRRKMIEEISSKMTKKAEVEAAPGTTPLTNLPGVGEKRAEQLKASGFASVEDIAKATLADLKAVGGIGEKMAERIYNSALELLGKGKTERDEGGS